MGSGSFHDWNLKEQQLELLFHGSLCFGFFGRSFAEKRNSGVILSGPKRRCSKCIFLNAFWPWDFLPPYKCFLKWPSLPEQFFWREHWEPIRRRQIKLHSTLLQ